MSCPTLELGLLPCGLLRESVCQAPNLEGDDLDSTNRLRNYQTPLLSKLLKDQTLFNMGLSPLNPAGIFSHFVSFLLILFLLSFDRDSLFVVEMDAKAIEMLTKGH